MEEVLKLTPAKVLKIRSLKGTLTAKECASRFGISAATVYSIWDRRIWRSLSCHS